MTNICGYPWRLMTINYVLLCVSGFHPVYTQRHTIQNRHIRKRTPVQLVPDSCVFKKKIASTFSTCLRSGNVDRNFYCIFVIENYYFKIKIFIFVCLECLRYVLEINVAPALIHLSLSMTISDIWDKNDHIRSMQAHYATMVLYTKDTLLVEKVSKIRQISHGVY